ncbi:hypothetical protein LS482_08555 [Sinomicrobium kalidii]|uniref:hypothetical protein n=1 Tax=Sinomicrobium kalidii TaxID=2900738 RepID=UPI001E2D2513|nr:hypothetical protein [Sinomicrobium kalidii]UGU17917.1 hypothetical protein LS482_08555 [Sinomicrobium kalidii]
MKKEIYWRFLLNTDKKNKAEKFSKNILETMPNAKIVILEPYWKDKSLFNLEVRHDLVNIIPDKVVFEVLETISLISNSWSIDLPINFNIEEFDFSGVAIDNLKWDYVSWTSFFLQDKDMPTTDVL